VDGIVEIETCPDDGPTISTFWVPDNFAKRLVFEGFVDGTVRGNKRYCSEMDMECALGDAVHVSHHETVSIF
jgi:hypothetical protein